MNVRDTPRDGKRVLLTGGTGYLGSLIAAQILHEGWADYVLLPTRRDVQDGEVPEALARELKALGAEVQDHASQVECVTWEGAEAATPEMLESLLRKGRIDTVVHCAGCLDYFDAAALQALNVEFTSRLVDASRKVGLECFVFVSTAYSAGYSGGVVREAALPDPGEDPTAYTATKRMAERVVADSGVPFLIVRPSIVIGSSVDGRYSGKRYGLYQQWMGIERLLLDRYHAEIHTVATDQPLNFLHQDVFQSSMSSILKWVPDGSYVNLVVDDQTAPSMKAVWRMVFEIMQPQSVVFYEHLREVDLRAINIRQRGYLTFAQTNLEIGAYPWRFDRGWLQALAGKGLAFVETTEATVRVCQDRFVRSSAPMQRYQERFADQFCGRTEYHQHQAQVPELTIA